MHKRIRLCLALAHAIGRVPTEEEWAETLEVLYESGRDIDTPEIAIDGILDTDLWFRCPVCAEWCLTPNGVCENADSYDGAGPFCSDDCVEQFRIQQGFDPRFEWGTY